MRKLLILLALSLTILSSCYYDTDEALFPQLSLKGCDTTQYTFSGAIQPMLNAYCMGCHRTQAPTLNSLADIIANENTINSDIISGKMPLNSSRLNSCYITQFKKWMDAGMPNN